MKTVTIKNPMGETYELPTILFMPKGVYTAYNDLLKMEFEIEKVKAELQTTDGQIKHGPKVFEYNEFMKALWDAMDAYLPGWKEFSVSMSLVDMKRALLMARVTKQDAEAAAEETDFLAQS